MLAEDRRILIRGALAVHERAKLNEIAKILQVDDSLVRETIYAMGSEPWFKDFGKVKGSFGKEEWRRSAILSPTRGQFARPLSDSELTTLGLSIYNRELPISMLAKLLDLGASDVKKLIFKLAGYGMISGTLAKDDFKVSKVLLQKLNRIENLDEDDRMVLGVLASNTEVKFDDLLREIGYPDDKANECKRRVYKLVALGCIFFGRRSNSYLRTLSESELYQNLTKIYPRSASTDDFLKNLVSIITVKGETTKDGHSWLSISDISKELGFKNEKEFRRAIYKAVGRTQLLVILDESRRKIFLPKDTPALLPLEEALREEEKPLEEKEAPKVEEAVPAPESEQMVNHFTLPEVAKEAPPAEIAQPPVGKVTALRGGEVVGDKYVFKVKVMNDTPYNITNVVVTIAAYPVDCLGRAPGSTELKRINVIESSGFASPTFTFRPTKDCVKGTVKAIVNYVDYLNELQTLKVEPHEISMVCGLLKPMVIDEKEFEQAIKDWVKSGGNIEVKGMNAKVVFEKAQDVLTESNFHIVASHEIPVEKEFVGVIKGFAQGKYSKKKIGLVVEIRGDIDGEDTFIRSETASEEEGMIAPTVQEVLDGFRKPRLFGKKSYYEKLGNMILQSAPELQGYKSGIVSLADLHVAMIKHEGTTETSIDSVEEAAKTLSKKGMIGGIRILPSGIKIVEIKPMELSEDLGKLLDLVSDTGVTTAAELIKKSDWSEEAVKTALEKLESSGVARKVAEAGMDKWYFPAFYKAVAQQEKPETTKPREEEAGEEGPEEAESDETPEPDGEDLT
jgi:DNA-binding Lrp family transcriptional regulator